MSRINKIATTKTQRKPRNWFYKLSDKDQAELLKVRANWHCRKPPLNGTEMAEVIKQHFPAIKVSYKEVYGWLRKKD